MSPDSLLIVPELLSQLERDAIVECFESLLRTRAIKTNHFDITLPDRPAMFVKYGNSDILAEASTQSFFYALAQGDSKAPVSTAPSADSAEKACVWHRFFKDHRAPLTFANSGAVMKYVNKAFLRRPSSAKPVFISFSDELFIYHSDISKDNFLLDPAAGQVWIIDFQHIGVLPEPFQQYGFFNIGDSLAAAVGKFLNIHPSDIADAMTKAAGVLQQIAGGSLGLNEFGERASAKGTAEQSEPSYLMARNGALCPV